MNSSTASAASPRATRARTSGAMARCSALSGGPGGAPARSSGVGVEASVMGSVPFWRFARLGLRQRRRLSRADQGLEEIDGDREDRGRVVLGRDLGEGLKIAELHGEGLRRDHGRRLRKLARRLELALGVD